MAALKFLLGTDEASDAAAGSDSEEEKTAVKGSVGLDREAVYKVGPRYNDLDCRLVGCISGGLEFRVWRSQVMGLE